MSQEVDWLIKYIAGDLCTIIVDFVISEMTRNGENEHTKKSKSEMSLSTKLSTFADNNWTKY